ncbi:MAG: protein phosphatase 2C domain-containing protein [Simkaniaceae bacterium]|nr:protein phosphatase 2C domain-containing protein [Simkaniaceae bacterium]
MNPLRFTLKSFGHSDIGLARPNNEDVWDRLMENGFFALADGMGGHRAGEIAAQEAIRFLCASIEELFITKKREWNIFDLCSLTKLFIESANSRIYSLSHKKKQYRGMGTTICVLLFHERFLIYGHVGDSRIYRYRRGKLDRLTVDHSLRNALTERNTALPAPELPFQHDHILTRALGTQGEVDVEMHITPVRQEDVYLMCSDGLTDVVSDVMIASVLEGHPDPEEATTSLINIAKSNGGHDNITIINVRVDEAYLPRS